MSNINFNNSEYSVDLKLIIEKDDELGVIPIAMGNVNKFVLEDSLAVPGYKGSIVFNNRFDIIGDLMTNNTWKGGRNVPVLMFNINSDDLPLNTPGSSIIGELALYKDADIVERIDDQMLAFLFEDVHTYSLKNTQFDISSNLETGINLNLIQKIYSESTQIKKYNISPSSQLNLRPFGTITKDDTYYNIYEKYNAYNISPTDGPVITKTRFGSSQSSSETSLDMFTIGEQTKSIVTRVNNKFTSLADVLSETFEVATRQSGIAQFKENVIEKYEIRNPDYDYLFRDIWSSYDIVDTSVNGTRIHELTYQDMLIEFEQSVCGEARSTLPERREEFINDIKILKDRDNIEDIIKNSVFKSFVFDNTVISFSVPGMVFRKSGTWIGINDFYKENSADNLAGLWYVINVKHIFEGSLYTTQITAVKFLNIVESKLRLARNFNNLRNFNNFEDLSNRSMLA